MLTVTPSQCQKYANVTPSQCQKNANRDAIWVDGRVGRWFGGLVDGQVGGRPCWWLGVWVVGWVGG